MNRNNEIIARIKFLIKELGLTQVEFANRIETDPSNLSKHLNGKLAINDSLINKIVISLGVSKTWLKDGTDIPFGKQVLETQKISVGNTLIPSVSGTPIYDLDVTAGGMERSRFFADEYIIGAINVPNISPECRIVRVSGDSMAPVISNGDYIAVRELTNLSQIFWGQIYVVILDDYRMVKYVRRHTDPNKLILRSENTNYDDIEITKTDIRDMMFVQNILHIDSRM